jgi:serine/threonine protein kinase
MDNFDLKKRLGVGHFGEVWLAHDVALDYDCALKCIPTEKVGNKANFFQEAQFLQEARHPNIVEVKGAGLLSDEIVYVSMELCPKGSLEDEARGGYIQLNRAKKIMIDVLRGLEYAHSKEIIHRDIKPGNILIGSLQEGKLSDFGLARSKKITLSAEPVSEYLYTLHLAPEIILGSPYSKLTDIYACGITLYRLVNGDTYIRQTPLKMREEKILKGEFPDREHYRWFVPRKMRLIINKALNVTPSKRFSSAIEMRRALEQVDIRIHWYEQKIEHGFRWSGNKMKSAFTYSIKLVEKDIKNWAITVEKGKSKSHLRRLTRFCWSNLSKVDAERKVKKILQGMVDGSLNI